MFQRNGGVENQVYIYIYIYALLALRSKYKAKRGGGWHSEGTRVRSLFRSFINPPPWIQPASIPLPTLPLPLAGFPLALLHAHAHADRQKFSRARTPISSPYVLIQFLIPLLAPPPTLPRFTTAPLCFSSLHLFPGFSLSEHPFSPSHTE